MSAAAFLQDRWGLLSVAILAAGLAAFFFSYDRRRPEPARVAAVAALAALAAGGRVPFAVIPNVQPTTFLVLLAGLVFGGEAGFAVGAVAALASNTFLGQGPWTPWQMAAWGLAGASGALLRPLARGGRFPVGAFTALGFAWGFLFGWFMNLWHWLAFMFPHTWLTFWAVQASSLWFDAAHAVGNAAFALALGRPAFAAARRFARPLQRDAGGKPSEPGSTERQEG